MSTTNNPSNNQVGSASNNTILSHENLNATPGQWDAYNDQTDVHGYYSGSGSPEGVVTANTGSTYTDTGAGASGLYYKTTDGVNTGWQLTGAGAGVVQVSNATSAVNDTTLVVIPIDNTTPQNTEGKEYMTISHTPLDATNTLFVEFNTFAITSTGFMTVALFVDAGASAVKGVVVGQNTDFSPCTIQYSQVAGSTSPITFRIRFGPDAGFLCGLNGGAAGGSAIGAAALANLRVTEVSSAAVVPPLASHEPSFFAVLPVTDVNVTGSAATYTLGQGNALTVTQKGSAMATDGTFTAPRDGFYQFNGNIQALQITGSANNFASAFVVNGSDFYPGIVTNGANDRTASNNVLYSVSSCFFLTALDTVVCQLTVQGEAGDTVDVFGAPVGSPTGSNFSGFILESGISTGKVVQEAFATEPNNFQVTAVIPVDDTPPQVGEGTQVITTNFTPLSATNRIRVSASCWVNHGNSNSTILALFDSGSSDARAAQITGSTSTSGSDVVYLDYERVTGTTSTLTIQLRAGSGSGVNVGINGTDVGAHLFGASSNITISITEFTP